MCRASSMFAALSTAYPERLSSLPVRRRKVSSSSTSNSVVSDIASSRPGGGQLDDEPRAVAVLALHANGAAMASDDAMGDREAEPGALADRLGGEERIPDAIQVILGNARAGVFDRHPHAALHGRGGDGESGGRHNGLHGVQYEVHSHGAGVGV